MAGQKRDAKWLKEQLSRVLDWDDMILGVLVDTIVGAAAPGADRSELDEMVQNFMADSPAGIALINDFLAAPTSASLSAAAAPSGSRGAAAAAPKSYAASAQPAAAAATGTAGGGHSRQQPHQLQQQKQQPHSQPQQLHGRGQHPPQQQSNAGSTGAAPPGWQALGPGAAAGSAASPAKGTVAAADYDGDDFGRFVVDDRSAGPGGLGGSKVIGGGCRGSKPSSSRDLQALDSRASGAEKPGLSADSGGGGKVLGMFKAGGRIKAPAAKPVGMRSPDGGALALAASLERKVINCLGCGKIYDCRSVTNDILRFLERSGVCTFCGDTVPLSYKDRQKAAAAAEAAEAAAAAAAASGSGGTAAEGALEDAATAAARAFKDRLVEYDRNAAKRTTVIDDQSDFFEIDTNAWLTDQEREELRQRRRLEEEAEAARRKRLTVTIDLIGRKVVLDEDARKAEETAAAAAAERAAAAAKAAAAVEALRNTDGDGGGGAYGSGVAFSGNALSGSGSGPTPEQLAAALDSLRRMKASINPAVAANAAPLFLPAAAAGGAGGGSGAAAAGGTAGTRRFAPTAGAPAAAAAAAAGVPSWSGRAGDRGAKTGGSKEGVGQQRPAVAAAPRPRRLERVQHDLGAEFGFDAFGAEVALDELMGGALLVSCNQQAGPYDICPPDVAPSTSYSSVSKAPAPARAAGAPPRAVSGLPPGVVLVKGYLTLDEQIQIVKQIRELGIGPGGFYVPSYSTGGRLNLQMMCLGLHWEPRTSKYEPTRSSYDGATPPPIPHWLVELCGRALTAASAAAAAAGGSRFPPLQPDICLANFYDRSGRLGMHQDKDEMADSLRAGMPVVSLSLGDAADFLYGSSRDAEAASSMRLDSGDLLVFGGPGRMIFHSIAKIYSNTAPQELLRATGMRPGRLNLTFRQYRARPI